VVAVTSPHDQPGLDDLVRAFADDWLRLSSPGVADALLADPVLVLGAAGTSPVPRAAFVAAVRSRSSATTDAGATTALLDSVAHPLGDRMVLATLSWSFQAGAGATTLVSDFLLQREGPDALRCVAYLPRTNVMDHVG
jgi:hypothetical protein